ncbi:MAG: DUF4422 domain-containing protein [Lachnospiraceae bacterium]|nr:DUF4422 domain-containing protein [Lachnospiraceae bacterium]
MKVKSIEDLTIFYYTEAEEQEASSVKNRCIVETQTAYVAFAANLIAGEELIKLYHSEAEKNEPSVLVICRGRHAAAIDYDGVFELVEYPIDAMLFPKRLIKSAGAYNEKLAALTDLELLCRLTCETGMCVLGESEEETNEKITVLEEHAYTLAYIIRRHLNSLHALKLTDRVFQRFCAYMEAEGMFSVFQRCVNTFLSDENTYRRIAAATAPFVVLRGDDTCGGVLQRFADDLSEALAECGQAVIKVDGSFKEYERLQGMTLKGIIGFQAVALEGNFYGGLMGTKLQFWFDYPLHFDRMLRNLPEDYYILCQDKNYAELIREYYHTENAIQFPPGGIERELICGERPYDIVFIGSFFEDNGRELRGEAEEFYNYMLGHPDITFEQGIKQLFYKGGAADEASFLEMAALLKPACRMIIGHFRNAVITTILKAGFTLHVYGESWRGYKCSDGYNLVIHPQVTVEESLTELSKAKIGLNVMSWHKAGMTERVANIMLSGAVCLSEETTYLHENMTAGEDIVCFKLTELERLPEIIAALLESSEVRERIASNAYRTAMARHTWRSRAEDLIELVDKADRRTLNIYVATHVSFNPPSDSTYIPLHVGRHGKRDLGYPGDDTGENISDLNFMYGELTGLFWIWQNIDNVDYVGLCHYRRYFISESGREMKKQEYLDLLKEYDAIVPKHAECDESYYEHFARAHNRHDLDAVGRALKRLYPEYCDAYNQAMDGHIYYWGNLMVTSLTILKAYSEWLFGIFLEAGEEIDVSGYDDYHKRVYGFLSEQMFYVFMLANGLKYCEVGVGISEEKAETSELKNTLKRLIAEGKISEAKRLFSDRLKTRPDLLLPGSDINGELKEIFRQLGGMG